jgi:hypothetical protein
MKKIFLLLCAASAAIGSIGTAHAMATQVNFGFVPVGTVSYTGATLGSSTSLTVPAFELVNTVQITGVFADDSGIAIGDLISLSPLAFVYTVGSTVAFDLTKAFTTTAGPNAGIYTATFTSLTATSSGADFLNLTFTGTISGPGGFSAVDVMLANCNQSGGTGAAVNCSFTEQGPPVPPSGVPEIDAASGAGALTLLGGMLALIGERRRRANKA